MVTDVQCDKVVLEKLVEANMLTPSDWLLRKFTPFCAKPCHVLHSLRNTPMSAFLG